jgi:LacI family transcriptional regulator
VYEHDLFCKNSFIYEYLYNFGLNIFDFRRIFLYTVIILRVRIKDIAKIAGVSSGTVDRVIHKRGEVSEETRKKVQVILNKSDYQPDIVARALTSKKTYLFSAIMPVSANGNDFWQAPKAGIDKAFGEIERFGIKINSYLFNQFDRDSFAAKAFDLLADHPDGILFAPVFLDDSIKFIRECQLRNIPVVLFNSNIEEANANSYIGQDAIQSGYLAARLLKYGLRSPADVLIINLAARKDNYHHVILRENGFRKYFENYPDTGIKLHTIDTNHSSDEKLIEELKHSFSVLQVKGIFVTNSRVFKVADFLKSNQIKGIHLIGYDLLPANIAALKNNTIGFLISQRPGEQAYKGIITLFNLAVLKKNPDPVQYMPIDIISNENIDYYDYKNKL